MKNPSKKYWEDRAAGRMVSYTAKAESAADTLGKAYYATARYLQGEANDVFNAFTDKFELSIAEAETMLKNAPNKSMFEQMKTALATCTDEQKKQQLETLLSSPAYAHRIGRLNDLDSKISDMCSRLASAEIGVDTEHLGNIIQNAYMQTVFDVTKGADYRAAFDLIPESRVKAILSTNWSGQMFSQRVWDNTNALADGLKHDMLVGIMAGKSEQHMADDIMNRCGVGAFEARRLVRTETTCVANMAELYGYKELDIDEYEFSACLDSRTSDLCRELDGKVFKRNSAQAGVNLPPMHPFCRSTMLPVLPSEEDLDKELAELCDEIGADVDFDEWERNLQQGEDGKWRYVAESAGKVKADKPMRFAGNGVDYMSKSFRPDYSDSTPISFSTSDGIKNIEVKKVTNSQFDMVTDNANRRNKAVRLAEKNLKAVKKMLPEGYVMPKVAVVDFDKRGLNVQAIGGYDKETGILYLNSKYNTSGKILDFVNEKAGYFANNTEFAPILHELGHKYYEDCVKSLAISENMEYNKAKISIDGKIYDFLHSNNLGDTLSKEISEYAQLGYDCHNYSEIIAECFSSKNLKDISESILKELRR